MVTVGTAPGQRWDNAPRGWGRSPAAGAQRPVVFEPGIRNSELSSNAGEAPEMLPRASKGKSICKSKLQELRGSRSTRAGCSGTPNKFGHPGARRDSAAPRDRSSNLSLGRPAREPQAEEGTPDPVPGGRRSQTPPRKGTRVSSAPRCRRGLPLRRASPSDPSPARPHPALGNSQNSQRTGKKRGARRKVELRGEGRQLGLRRGAKRRGGTRGPHSGHPPREGDPEGERWGPGAGSPRRSHHTRAHTPPPFPPHPAWKR